MYRQEWGNALYLILSKFILFLVLFFTKKENGDSSNAKEICNRLLFEELEKVKNYCMRNVNIFHAFECKRQILHLG